MYRNRYFLLRHSKCIIFIHVFLLVASIIGFAYDYSIKELGLNKYLQKEFRNVILDELERQANERKLIPAYSTNTFETMADNQIFIKTEQGTIQVELDSLKRNIAEIPFVRSLHSTLLFENFISSDSIYTRYMNHIKARKVSADIALLYKGEKTDSVKVGDLPLIKSSNRLVCYYAGYGNEFEFTLYASIPFYIVLANCNSYIWIFIILFFRNIFLYMAKV